MSWQQGRTTIDRLLAAGELQQVSPDTDAARHLVTSAERHLSPPVDSDEIQDALDQARRMVSFADTLVNHLPVY